MNVSMNKFQQRSKWNAEQAESPGTGSWHYVVGTIIDVYDQEYKELNPKDPIVLKSNAHPGLIYAKVFVERQGELVLPFKETEDQVYSTYGNAILLKRRRVKIEFRNMDIFSGEIIVIKGYGEPLLNLTKVSATFDIGAIV